MSTPTTADTIRALAAAGMSPAEITHALGVSYGRVQSALRAASATRGRPAKGVPCPVCGASASHQRKRLQAS